MKIQSLEGIDAATKDNVAVVMAPVKSLRTSLMTLSGEGRVIDENLFFFAAGMEAMTGRACVSCVAGLLPPPISVAVTDWAGGWRQAGCGTRRA